MIRRESVLGIIPARGGSKRLIRKNIRLLAGKPLIGYTIEAGLKSLWIDKLVVSTEDREIAEIASKFGADVPFLRPQELAQDESSSIDVVMHAINFYANTFDKKFGYIALLQPTSPLRDHREIDKAFELLEEKQADAVISVCKAKHNPLWTNRISDDLSLACFLPEISNNKRSRDLPKYYSLNGAIYICKTERLLNERTFFIQSNIFAHIMEDEKSIDIDTELDFKLCEVLLNEKTRDSKIE